MQRRHFIRKTALTLVSVTGMVAAISYFRQFFPRLAGQKRRITIGDAAQFPVDTYTYLDEHNCLFTGTMRESGLYRQSAPIWDASLRRAGWIRMPLPRILLQHKGRGPFRTRTP